MKINSRIVLLNCFLPYVFLGGVLYKVMQLINFSTNSLVLFFVKGILFAVLFISLALFMLNRDEKKFVLNFFRRK